MDFEQIYSQYKSDPQDFSLNNVNYFPDYDEQFDQFFSITESDALEKFLDNLTGSNGNTNNNTHSKQQNYEKPLNYNNIATTNNDHFDNTNPAVAYQQENLQSNLLKSKNFGLTSGETGNELPLPMPVPKSLSQSLREDENTASAPSFNTMFDLHTMKTFNSTSEQDQIRQGLKLEYSKDLYERDLYKQDLYTNKKDASTLPKLYNKDLYTNNDIYKQKVYNNNDNFKIYGKDTTRHDLFQDRLKQDLYQEHINKGLKHDIFDNGLNNNIINNNKPEINGYELSYSDYRLDNSNSNSHLDNSNSLNNSASNIASVNPIPNYHNSQFKFKPDHESLKKELNEAFSYPVERSNLPFQLPTPDSPKKKKRSNNKHLLTLEQKRLNHTHSEQKRRQLCKSAYERCLKLIIDIEKFNALPSNLLNKKSKRAKLNKQGLPNLSKHSALTRISEEILTIREKNDKLKQLLQMSNTQDYHLQR